jgi:anhydro-N-acetylmuramic acid kinase
MRVAGMISGTSHDGIDVAVVDFDHDADGAILTGRVLHTDSVPYDPALRARLIAALPPSPTTLDEITRLDTEIGQAFARVAADAADAVGGVDAVCSHGQTVFHWVEGRHALGTLQIGQPAWIAERLGVPVVADVRIRDITAGGHGAPLASFLDELLLRGVGRAGALNLGGISNMTIVDGAEVSAFDIGPANALIDAIVVAYGLDPLGYDDDARIARSGRVDAALLEALLADPYYALEPPKSTGKEHFHLAYVHEHVNALGRDIPLVDIVATLTELTVRTVADAVARAQLGTLVVSGGGCRNPLIMAGLRAALPDVRIVLADEFGAPADSKEAILFALIGWCTLHGVAGVVAGGTGASAPRILGSITPGAGPLVLPEPVATVAALRLEADA